MMNNENAPLPSRRICGAVEAIEPNQGVWLSPLQKDSREQVWLAMAEIDPATRGRVKVGAVVVEVGRGRRQIRRAARGVG